MTDRTWSRLCAAPAGVPGREVGLDGRPGAPALSRVAGGGSQDEDPARLRVYPTVSYSETLLCLLEVDSISDSISIY